MKIQRDQYPADSSLKRLRDFITAPFKRGQAKEEQPGEDKGEAGEAVDKRRAGKTS